MPMPPKISVRLSHASLAATPTFMMLSASEVSDSRPKSDSSHRSTTRSCAQNPYTREPTWNYNTKVSYRVDHVSGTLCLNVLQYCHNCSQATDVYQTCHKCGAIVCVAPRGTRGCIMAESLLGVQLFMCRTCLRKRKLPVEVGILTD